MRNIWHVLPCGAMYTFKEYGLQDIAAPIIDYMWENIPKSELAKITDPSSVGRKKKQWCARAYSQLMRMVWQEIITELLNSNRIKIYRGAGKWAYMYIGVIPDNPKRISKPKKRYNPNWHTNGKRYGVVLDGVKHNYYFRMTAAKRNDLADRIKRGQSFHG